jgi:hypothetical protein
LGLEESIGISGERLSATELARKAEQIGHRSHRLPELTLGQSVESAGNWALWRSASMAGEEQHHPKRGLEQQIQPPANEQKQEKVIEHGYGFGI